MWMNVNEMNDMKGNKILWQNQIITSMSKWRIWALCWGVNSFESLGRMLESGQPPVCLSSIHFLKVDPWIWTDDMEYEDASRKKHVPQGSVMRMLAAKKLRNNTTSWHSSLLDLCLAWSWGRPGSFMVSLQGLFQEGGGHLQRLANAKAKAACPCPGPLIFLQTDGCQLCQVK